MLISYRYRRGRNLRCEVSMIVSFLLTVISTLDAAPAVTVTDALAKDATCSEVIEYLDAPKEKESSSLRLNADDRFVRLRCMGGEPRRTVVFDDSSFGCFVVVI